MRTHGRKFSKNILGQRLNIDRFKYQKNYKLNKKLKWYTLTETTITTAAVTKACIIKNVTSLLAVTFNNNYPSNFWWYCVQSMYINDDRDCQGGGGGGGQEWSHRGVGVIPWAGCEYHNSTLINSDCTYVINTYSPATKTEISTEIIGFFTCLKLHQKEYALPHAMGEIL